MLSQALVQTLDGLGSTFHIPPSVLGLSVLAWGNSFGELITNSYLAQEVSTTSAITACYGGPILSNLRIIFYSFL